MQKLAELEIKHARLKCKLDESLSINDEQQENFSSIKRKYEEELRSATLEINEVNERLRAQAPASSLMVPLLVNVATGIDADFLDACAKSLGWSHHAVTGC